MEEEKIECTGKGVFSLIMGVICLAMAIYLLIITIKMEQVIILAYLVVILAFGLAMYYLLYWKNKKIVMSDNEIIYYPIIGKVRTYLWNDVKKIYMDCEMMKNCGETVKLIMKKGYLKTNI